MTDSEWWACSDPSQLWDIIFPCDADDAEYPSSRKARLFACACWRRVWHVLRHPALRQAIEVAESFADTTWEDYQQQEERRAEAERLARAAVEEIQLSIPLDVEMESLPDLPPDLYQDYMSLRWVLIPEETLAQTGCRAAQAIPGIIESWGSWLDRYRVLSLGPDAAREAADNTQERPIQCDYLRCLFFPTRGGRPAGRVSRDFTPLVRSLAEAAYTERILPTGTLDPERLAVLSDALEEANGGDEMLLAHLRSSRPHLRGCWAVDEILGRNR